MLLMRSMEQVQDDDGELKWVEVDKFEFTPKRHARVVHECLACLSAVKKTNHQMPS